MSKREPSSLIESPISVLAQDLTLPQPYTALEDYESFEVVDGKTYRFQRVVDHVTKRYPRVDPDTAPFTRPYELIEVRPAELAADTNLVAHTAAVQRIEPEVTELVKAPRQAQTQANRLLAIALLVAAFGFGLGAAFLVL